MEFREKYLYDRLKALSDSDYYPFHMPGHKRIPGGQPWNAQSGAHEFDGLRGLYGIDITEIDDFDNLHAPEGILKEAMERAAAFAGAEKTYFLVNGSSCGVLSALMACADGGGKVLMGRNAHKSAYHAVYLGRMQPVYVMPQVVEEYGFAGGILPEDIEKALEEETDVKAVFLTSPTYDGMLSDVERIAEICHARQIPLIVDEAHGAHLPLFPEWKSAVACGADFVIQSIHKTLPAPTQTALLHINGTLADRERTERYLQMFQSSSPSYVLMSGMDECFRLLEAEGKELAARFRENKKAFDESLKGLSVLHLYGDEKDREAWEKYGIRSADWGKLVISIKNMLINGKVLYDRLRFKYYLQLEMAAPSYALAMTTIMDTREGFERLSKALLEMDEELSAQKALPDWAEPVGALSDGRKPFVENLYYKERNPIQLSMFEAQNLPKEWIPLKQAAGRTAADVVSIYPPGIPLLVPGEQITEGLFEFIKTALAGQFNVQGIQGENEALIPVLRGFAK